MLTNLTPPPMPDVAASQLHDKDAARALERALAGWNRLQLIDALESAKVFISAAEKALARKEG